MAEHDERTQRITELFGTVMDRESAAELSGMVAAIPWDDLARRSDVEHLGSDLRTEMAALGSDLRGEMAALGSDLRGEALLSRAELRAEMVGLKGELRNDMADVRREVGDLRVEVYALRGQLPKLIAANIASMVGVAALVVGAGAL